VTKEQFWKNWEPDWATDSTRRRFMKQLNQVIKEYTNPLFAGIATAIFELEQTYKKGGKK